MFKKNNKKNDKANEAVDIPTREIKETKKTDQTDQITDKKTSTISEGLIIKGDITGNTNLDIYGSFEGEIKLENNTVNIETTAKIKANINAKSIRVNGSVVGNLVASEKILLTNKGSVVGDISSNKVEIQDGANFDGNVSMKKTNTPNTKA